MLIVPVVAVMFLTLSAEAARWKSGGPKTWNDGVQKSEALLQEGRYAEALEITGAVVKDMGNTLLAGEKSDRALGTALALHALAEAGTGELRAAVWHWFLAESFKPDLAQTSLERYGEAGEVLEAERRRTLDLIETGTVQPTSGDGAEVGGLGDRCGDLEYPVRTAGPHPQYSRELREAGIEGLVILRTWVDAEGGVHRPVVLKAAAPSMAYLAAEAVRQWRFEPARCNGEAVPFEYNLTVNMILDR